MFHCFKVLGATVPICAYIQRVLVAEQHHQQPGTIDWIRTDCPNLREYIRDDDTYLQFRHVRQVEYANSFGCAK
jgi:hypothetical protein